MTEHTLRLEELERHRIGHDLYSDTDLELLPATDAWGSYPKLTMLLAFFEPHDERADRPQLRELAHRAIATGTWRFKQKVVQMAWRRRELRSLQPRHIDILRAMDRGNLDIAIRDAKLPNWLQWKILREGDADWRQRIVFAMCHDVDVARQLIDHKDLYVRWWATRSGQLEEADYRRLAKSEESRIRAAVAGAVSCPPDVLQDLCDDPAYEVRLAATDRFWDYRFPDPEGTREKLYATEDNRLRAAIAKHLPREHPWMERVARHSDPVVRRGSAENRSLPRHLQDDLLNDPDSETRERARKSLPYWRALAKRQR